MTDLLTNRECDRLRDAAKSSYKTIGAFRDHMDYAVKQYVGNRYSKNGSKQTVPANFIEQAKHTFQQRLASQNPRVYVTSPLSWLAPAAARFDRAIDRMLIDLDFADILENFVLNAMFCPVGAIKVGRTHRGTAEVDGAEIALGEPYATSVAFPDWVHDAEANDWKDVEFMGDRYTLPFAWARDSGLFKADALRKLKPKERGGREDDGERRAGEVARGDAYARDSFQDHIDLWDLFLPQYCAVVTLGGSLDGPVVREQRWTGRRKGPYHLLWFNKVLNTLEGLPPVATWIEDHLIANKVYRKLGNQASRQKTGFGYTSGSHEDAQRTKDFVDGQFFKMNRPDGVKPFNMPGADPSSMAFYQQHREKFARDAGNLDMLGGLGAQSPTLGQDQMLDTNSAQRIVDMQQRVVRAVKGIVEHLADLLHSEDTVDYDDLFVPIEGTEIEIPVRYCPETRQGRRQDFRLNITPYSLQHRSPGQKLQMITQLVQTLIIPMLPQLQAQGIVFDIEAFLDIVADYGDLDEMRRIVVFTGEMLEQEVGGGSHERTMPGMTQRTVTRETHPRNTPGAQVNAMLQGLMGNRLQPNEAARAMQPTG